MLITDVGAGTIGVSWTTLLAAAAADTHPTAARDRTEAAVVAAR